MRLLNSSTPTLRVQQYGKRGGGGDGDDGQWQHRQQKTKYQPPDHLPHTSSYCGETGRVGALIAWIYPFAKYFERNVVIIHQGSTGSWGEHLFHTPPPYQTPHPGLNLPGLDYPGSNNPGLDHPGSNNPGSNPPGLDNSEVQRHPIHIHLCQEDHN